MSRELILIRGVSGSGKTTLAHKLKLSPDDHHVYAADDYFYDCDGSYHFDPHFLGEAHTACLSKTMEAMRQEADRVIVHNTFTRNSEMEPYNVWAKRYGYTICVIRMENDFGNTHNVPEQALKRQKERFEDNELS